MKLCHVYALVGCCFGLILAARVVLRGDYIAAEFIGLFSAAGFIKAGDRRTHIRIEWSKPGIVEYLLQLSTVVDTCHWTGITAWRRISGLDDDCARCIDGAGTLTPSPAGVV